ncbi:MAG: prephenate dehydratase [Actinomycetaceae bacterium]|nr:prephenate dehydratase [Actinomycetaceae bacterium]
MHNQTSFPGPEVPGKVKIAFLGPFGTFTEQALRQVAPEGAEAIPCTSVPHALDEVRSGRAHRAVVPIENSIEGGVNATIDSLSHGSPLVIVAEMVVEVSFELAIHPSKTGEKSEIKRIGTHPHAWAQCRKWVAENYPDAVHVPATSTAAAARLIAEDENPGIDAALCAKTSVERYGLRSLHSGVADNKGAVTRFVMVAPLGAIPEPTGADKTTVQVRLPDNEAGALLSMLEQFAVRGVNLSRIESRPAGGPLGSYEFSIDIEGHVTEERVAAALIGLHRTCPQIRFIGSYPRVDGQRPTIQAGTTDEDFVTARAWISEVLGGSSN